ncbi:class I SAM-dependent methyltransferase [Modicisalibacter tunisiensis]|uniref:Class I SAM-dependent methyltransferase n=2 Tax=Modicisalibacter tunisiensis TaxID=390637 RepID=A0ABS7WWD2_9GAMM|nr:class I SAM-dependent methyltransferase [Modicisalibacter tunisiensis]MBZ9566655.1 class I SAM-dependent methyltransferase [Modicisalibacter tunisiensis]
MTQPTLTECYKAHDGRVSDKWSLYLDEYERLFAPIRNKPIHLLEIGVQNGGSLEIWGEYFPQAQKIVGCDINPACAQLNYRKPTINVVIGDVNKDDTLAQVFKHAEQYDIVIDDGSHTSQDIIHTFCTLLPHVKQGGLFVAEDLHCSYWKKFNGGLYEPRAAMAFFKALADIPNFEHWGLEGHTRRRVLAPFGISEELTETLLTEIHSVEFINSMCVINRQPAEKNVLGLRCVAGELEEVASVKQVNGTSSPTPAQQFPAPNTGSLTSNLQEITETLQAKIAENEAQQELLKSKNKEIQELNHLREQMHEQLVRAEAQLALLKDLLLDDSVL